MTPRHLLPILSALFLVLTGHAEKPTVHHREKPLTKAELAAHKEQYHVISERLLAGVPEIRVLSTERPDSTFDAVEADLEDVYFAHVFGQKESAVAV